MSKAPEIQCPRCNAVGKVTCDLAGSKPLGDGHYTVEPRFRVQWTRNGKPHSLDTNVKQDDLDDPDFGCGQD